MSAPPSPAAAPADAPLAFLRYVDVALVLFALPFVLLAELPLLGYAVGAGVWTAQRALTFAVERRGRSMAPRAALGLQAGVMFARAWLVALAIVLAGVLGAEADGAMAAVVVLVAFSVAFAMALLTRPASTRSPSP